MQCSLIGASAFIKLGVLASVLSRFQKQWQGSCVVLQELIYIAYSFLWLDNRFTKLVYTSVLSEIWLLRLQRFGMRIGFSSNLN